MINKTFLSADGKTEVEYYIFENKTSKPKGIVQISHGMQDHILRYGDLIEHLTNKGFIVCGCDDLGHGKTSKLKETDGFFAEKNGDKFVLNDLHTLTTIVKNEYKDVPFFLLGHSMGSFFARAYASKFPNELDGLILCGTSGKVFGTGLGIKLLDMVMFFKGKKQYCTLVENIMLSSYFKYIEDVKTKKEWVTSDPVKLKEYETDPRTNFRFTASAYKDMLKTLKKVNTNGWAKSLPKDMAILICSGSHDPVGAYGKGICGVYKLLEKQKMSDVQMKLYSGARHELHNELPHIREEFFNDVENWLNQKVDKQKNK